MNNRTDFLKEEFDHTKNKKTFEEALKDKDNNKIKYYWRCKKYGDTWETSMHNRLIRGRDCQYCSNQEVNKRNCLATTHPHLVKEWSSVNKIKPTEVVAGNNKDEIIWECEKYKHTWPAKINSRAKINPTGCPYCAHRLASPQYNLQTEYPDIASEYDFSLNNNKATDVLPGSSVSVNWKCKNCSHQWKSEIRKRTINKERCPQCTDKEATLSNCLAVKHKSLMLEWDFEKNDINPFKITAKNIGEKKVNWICEKGHPYSASVYHRTKTIKPTGCPYCNHKKTTLDKSVLADAFLSGEWDYELNDKKNYHIDKISLKSHKKINWICSTNGCNHKWPATPANRTGKNHTGCPACSLRINKQGTSKEEIYIREKIKTIFPSTEGAQKRTNIVFNNSSLTIDIWISEMNLGIEYDPYYTHKDKVEFDKEKTRVLFENGYHLIRVRHFALDKVNDNDVVFSPKETIDNIVKKILIAILVYKGKYMLKREKERLEQEIAKLK